MEWARGLTDKTARELVDFSPSQGAVVLPESLKRATGVNVIKESVVVEDRLGALSIEFSSGRIRRINDHSDVAVLGLTQALLNYHSSVRSLCQIICVYAARTYARTSKNYSKPCRATDTRLYYLLSTPKHDLSVSIGSRVQCEAHVWRANPFLAHLNIVVQ